MPTDMVTGSIPVAGDRRDVTLRAARPHEATTLTALALRSKAHWGYDPGSIAAFTPELTFSPDYVSRHPSFAVVAGGRIAGFCTLEPVDRASMELGALFVDPPEMGRGLGRALLEHACAYARARGCRRLVVQGDPHAEGFYLALGATRAGSRESGSIPGRMLPVFEIVL